MKKFHIIATVFVFSICIFTCSYGQENSMDPSYILGQYRESLKNSVPVLFDFQSELNDQTNHFVEKSFGQIRYDGINLQRIQRNGSVVEAKNNKERTLEFLVCQNTAYLEIFFGNEIDMSDIAVTSFLEIPSDLGTIQKLGEQSILFGWIYLDASPYFIPDILNFLKQDSIVFQREGNGKFVLTGKKDDIEIMLQFDPDVNNALSFLSYKRLTSLPQLDDTYQYQVKSFIKQDNFFFPEEYCLDITRKGGDFIFNGRKLVSPKTQSRYDIKLKNIHKETKPITKKDMISRIPNGTSVYMQDAPQIQYVWIDGKIEPRTDELMLKIARGNHKFIPGVEEPRFWIMALGVIFIIVGFSLKVKSLIQQWREK